MTRKSTPLREDYDARPKLSVFGERTFTREPYQRVSLQHAQLQVPFNRHSLEEHKTMLYTHFPEEVAFKRRDFALLQWI